MAKALLHLTVEHDNGAPETFDVRPATVVGFERKFGIGFAAALSDLHMEHMYWLAWDSEHKAGNVVKPFDAWLESVVDVDIVKDDAPL